jgi:hypothetical protein
LNTVWRVRSARTQKYRDFSTCREAIAEAFTGIVEHYIIGEEAGYADISVVRSFNVDGSPDWSFRVNGDHFVNVFRTEEDYGGKPSK